MREKVTVIGSGAVGGTVAYGIVSKNLADVILLDVIEGLPQAKALDIMQAGAVERFNSNIIGTNNYEDVADSKIIVVTAGMTRKPGMSRLDLIRKNSEIVEEVTKNIVKYAPQCMILMVTNPLDIMTYKAFKISGFESNRVFGQAGVLDSARFSYFISKQLGVPMDNISAMVLGSHGDFMVPVPRYTTVKGVPITELLSQDIIERLIEKTRKGGGEIVNLLKTGSAYYAPAASTVKMVEAVLNDEKSILPVTAYLEGEYGLKNIYIGVPVKLGSKGVEQIVEIDLNEEEKEALYKSAQINRENLKEI